MFFQQNKEQLYNGTKHSLQCDKIFQTCCKIQILGRWSETFERDFNSRWLMHYMSLVNSVATLNSVITEK